MEWLAFTYTGSSWFVPKHMFHLCGKLLKSCEHLKYKVGISNVELTFIKMKVRRKDSRLCKQVHEY